MNLKKLGKEILKPRSYDAAQDLIQGDYQEALQQVALATFLRSCIAYIGIRAIGFSHSEAIKSSLAGNVAITTGVMSYYLIEDNL